MYRTKITPPTEIASEQLRYTTFIDPTQPKHRAAVSSLNLDTFIRKPTLSMQPLEIYPVPFFDDDASESPNHHNNNLAIPDTKKLSTVPAGVPSLVAYSSQETNESSSSSSRWGATQISIPDGRKMSMYKVAETRLQVQTETANTSCQNASQLAEALESPPKLRRSISELSHIPVKGGDTVYTYEESDDEAYENPQFNVPEDHRTKTVVECDRRVSEARSEALEKYRGELTSRLRGIMSDIDSKIDHLICAAKTDFASLKRDYVKSIRPHPRR